MPMSKTSKIIDAVLCLVAAALTIWIVLIFADANINHYTAYMDADVAGETLLAKACWENGGWQPDTWFMSTGREIFAAARLAPFIYPYVEYNLNLSMGIACTIMVIALVGCMLFFNFEIGLTLKESLIMLILSLTMAVPAGSIHKMLYLYGVMYLGLFITMFFVMAVYARSLRLKKLSLLSIISLALAVINGLQGMHASVFIFMPLLGTEILRRLVLLLQKKKDEAKFVSAFAVILAIAAMAAAIFWGTHMDGDTSRNIRHAPEKFLQEVWPSFMEVLSIDRMKYLVMFLVGFGILGVVVALWHFKETPSLWGVLIIPVELMVVILSTTFSTVDVAPRYFLTEIFLVATGVALLLHYLDPRVASIIAVIVIVFGVHSAIVFDKALIKEDHSEDTTYMEMVKWMEKNGYEYGYSSFDHASTMTVISNDKVKIRQLNSFEDLSAMKWLSDATWYPPIKDDQGATCYVVSKSYEDEFKKFLTDNTPTIANQQQFGDFTIYVLDKDYTYLEQ